MFNLYESFFTLIFKGLQSINQLINQPTTQSVSQAINQFISIIPDIKNNL